MKKFEVPEMSCGHCAATITRAIAAIDSGARVACDLPSRTVTIDDATASEIALIASMQAAGYKASPLH